jgi:hypothetical protein
VPPPTRKPSKYEPLADWLAAQPGGSVTLTIDAIEQILGFHLPRSGWATQNWWRSRRASCYHSRTWRAAGWEVTRIDWARREVTFGRTEPDA